MSRATKPKRKTAAKKIAAAERGYKDVVAVGGANKDWFLSFIGEDTDVWQNAFALTARVRDLFKTNPIYIKYRELLWANIFGENGIMLRMKIKETEDRVIHTPDEKMALIAYEKRINRIRKWAAERTGQPLEEYRAYKLADAMARSKPDDILERKAKIQVGDPDVFANLLIERKYAEWQRAEYCDVRGYRNYHVLRQLRLINGVRDGDVFKRHIRDPKVNKFGYSLQIIGGEWCDRFYNTRLNNGNVVIMGIEYEMSPWGIGKKVAYYFIKRQPNDWQFTVAGGFDFSNGRLHARVPAEEIVHYARPVDAEGTRPAPWVAASIPSSRQLDQAMLAEVIAWRESACKTGFYYSDVLPEGGVPLDMLPDPTTGIRTEPMVPGSTMGLPLYVKYQERNPTHPNANVVEFRESAGRHVAAGMPAGDYNVLFNDLKNINFSAGRLGRLDTNEMSKMLQRFDIDVAERPIFEAWLEMALITGEIPLPFTKEKFAKFNRPLFQGRRWAQVDEVKAVNAAALRVANKFSSRNRECADEGIDFEENAIELAEEEMLLESLGLDSATTVEHEPAQPAEEIAIGETGAETGGTKKPAPVKKPVKASNGAHEELEFSRV